MIMTMKNQLFTQDKVIIISNFKSVKGSLPFFDKAEKYSILVFLITF